MGQECCVLCICCGEEKALEAFTKQIQQEFPAWPDGQAGAIASWMLATYDLMPHGTTDDLKAAIFGLVTGHAKQD